MKQGVTATSVSNRVVRRRISPGALAAAAVALTLALGACGGSNEVGDGGSATAGSGTGSTEEIKAGAAMIGVKNDKATNESTMSGIEAAMDKFPNLRLEAVLENRHTDQQRNDAIQTLGPANDVVLAMSSTFGPILDIQAPNFPDTYFIDIGGYTQKEHPNVTGWANDWGAPAYVAGVVAGNMTKSDVVGFIGGAEIPPTIHAGKGYEAGVKSVDSDIQVLSNIVGDFNDIAKAKAATSAMIADGADAVFMFLDIARAGGYAAAKESGQNPAMFNIVVPGCDNYANIVGTELVDNGAAAERLLTEYVEGTLKPGTIFAGLDDPDVQTFKLCPKYEKDAKIAKITEDSITGINDGSIKVPADALNPRPDYPYREGFDGETVTP